MTAYPIELTTRDGEQIRFDCAEDQNLIDAAAAVDIILPSQCKQGGCGACHAHATAGDYLLGEHSPDALPKDGGHGSLLMCRTYPRSALSIAAPFDHNRVLFQAIPRREAEIAELAAIGENTVRLVLQLLPDADDSRAAQFEPGQFMELELPGGDLKRAYSLANNGNWEGRLEFLIRLQPNGRFSTFLKEQAKTGDKLMVRGPQGAFGLEETGLRPRWFVAGGTGLAPMLSMLRRMAEWQEPHEARLFFGVNREEELFALDELEELKAALPQLRVEICVWKPGDAWQGYAGTPVDALRRDLAEAKTTPDIYLCGPPALIDFAETAARELGVGEEQIFSERFLPS
ncbi:aromatic/alkene monooxygenase hydroxylase FAD-binding subunit MmoC [Methylogaea oryzae]|uniref:CDP-6-deoxy-delta-3,4-glucoseen reductase n=1 Tax=Methylogaea oryzae TaxID=1295382 RepID=A0A8D4VU70_9GAMM|nr:FAD-binding oxidoreductase [Methylogaea oryzae]BBL72717.1 CDP-6-deoxy-delta-3,4-glucoseen reductase [Methylogaea oryzae]